MIGLIAVTAAGRAAAAHLAASWPGETRAYQGPAARSLPAAWAECDALVCFLAAGAVIRLIAPLLDGKRADPAVVCVDEAARFAVPLVGGHAAGANALAARVCAVLGATPVITTASDAAGLPGLDDLGWPAEGAIAAVSRALLDGVPVVLDSDQTWPLPPLPVTRARQRVTARGPAGGNVHGAGGNVDGEGGPGGDGDGDGAASGEGSSGEGPAGYRILVTDRIVPVGGRTAVLRPPSLVVGVGASRNVSADEVNGLIDAALAGAGLSPASVTALATVDAKAAEPGLAAVAGQRGWPLLTYPAARLAAVPVPHPSEAALAAVGTPSVAEAAALASADVLVAGKRKSAMATVAIARLRPRGRLAVIGLGPGSRDLLAPRAVAELRRASVLVGLDQYVDQVRDLLRPGTRVLDSGLGAEEERAATAVAQARLGHAVALVSSGDAGVYAMASPALLQAAAGPAAGEATCGETTCGEVADCVTADRDAAGGSTGGGDMANRDMANRDRAGGGAGGGDTADRVTANRDTAGSGAAGRCTAGGDTAGGDTRSGHAGNGGGDIDIVVVPGITASLAAAALLGAPLGHDHAVISLSDLHTPWELIERRVRAAAEADYVTVFYNPRSTGRHWQLGQALAVLAAHRSPATPAAIVRNAARPGQHVRLTTLGELDPRDADMLSLVIVGASTSRAVAGRMITPRGYAWQPW